MEWNANLELLLTKKTNSLDSYAVEQRALPSEEEEHCTRRGPCYEDVHVSHQNH